MIQPLFVFSDWGLLILRVALGVIMVAHGWPKLKNLKGTAAGFKAMGFKPPKFWGTVAAIVEFFGGLALILGLFTQFFAFLIAIQFIVAILKVKGKMGFVNGYEFDLLILAAAFALMILGAGAISLDTAWGTILY